MKKGNNIFILICTFAYLHISTSIAAQDNLLDSLLSLVKTEKQDTVKINHLNKLCREFEGFGVYDSAMLFANSAKELSNVILRESSNTTIKNTAKRGLATSYLNQGMVNDDQGNYQEALKNYADALKIFEVLNYQQGIADCHSCMGTAYCTLGNFPEALKNAFEALKIREKIADKRGIAASLNNIGTIYYEQLNYPEALLKFSAALKINVEMGNENWIAINYVNIGGVNSDLGNLEEALRNYFEGLKMLEKIGNTPGVSACYNNIGIIYKQQGKYEEALKNYFAGLKIQEEIGNTFGICGSYGNIGEVYIKQKKYKEAEQYLFKARDLPRKIGYKECLSQVYGDLTELDSAMGNFKGAYENHKLFVLYRDSIDNEETRKKTIQTQMTYDFEKKEAVASVEHKKELENQASLANEKSRKQKIVIGFVVFGLLLVIVFAGFILRSLRVTRKQKMVIEVQKSIVEEKQKEILDSIRYAKRIQQSLLPTEKFIAKSLNRLNSNS